MNGRLRFAAAMAVFVIGAAGAAIGASPRDDAIRPILTLLHDARFDEADEAAGRLVVRAPDDPADVFLHAFVLWWRLLYDDANAGLQSTFEERLLRAAAVGDASRPDENPDAAVWTGYSHLLLAQLRANQRKTLSAAHEARDAHRLLTSAARARPTSGEPYFGLGTYNYYAGRVSVLAKGIRFFLRLPGGDRDRGLEQLDRAARTSASFALESRLLRATILAGRHERHYAEAQIEVDRALASAPDALVVLDAAARLDLTLDRPERAAERLDHALDRAARAPRTDAAVLAALRFQRARADFSRFRPDLAQSRLRELLASPGVPARLKQDARQLEASARFLLSGPSEAGEGSGGAAPAPAVWKRVVAALEAESSGDLAGAVRRLEDLVRETPADPVAALFLGRVRLRSGDGTRALAGLLAAERSQALPEAWVGPCRLLAGQAADLSGQRERARELYRSATKTPGLIAGGAAYFHDAVPYAAPR